MCNEGLLIGTQTTGLQVRKAGKLLPKNPKKMEEKPERAKNMFNARNERRQGGFGSGGPWQPISKKIPGALAPVLLHTARICQDPHESLQWQGWADMLTVLVPLPASIRWDVL